MANACNLGQSAIAPGPRNTIIASPLILGLILAFAEQSGFVCRRCRAATLVWMSTVACRASPHFSRKRRMRGDGIGGWNSLLSATEFAD